jgi:hypothetical protein
MPLMNEYDNTRQRGRLTITGGGFRPGHMTYESVAVIASECPFAGNRAARNRSKTLRCFAAGSTIENSPARAGLKTVRT